MKQTGLLYRFDPRDYRAGASPLVHDLKNLLSDWKNWKPTDERQAKDFTFDTMSCATFSGLNTCETTFDFENDKGLVPLQHLAWLKDNGYLDESGKLNLSDRFTAIMSGTTEQGNYLQNVWDSIRKDGVLPEKDLPFGGNSWAEYHNKAVITPAMIAKAKKSLDIFESAYEWASNLPMDIKENLKKCPLHVAINNGSHAVELLNPTTRFDTYPPFTIPQTDPITYVLMGFFKIKPVAVVTLKKGSSGDAVKALQNDLHTLGYFYGKVDGKYGDITANAVKAFQKENSLTVDGVAGKLTLAKIAELKKKLA